MAPEVTPELVEKKNIQRAALRREYWKLFTSPHNKDGYVFDPAVQRFLSMRVSRIEHFRETPTTVLKGLAFLVVPISLTVYFLHKKRAEQEKAYRSGQVAYKDRLFKFV